MKGYLKQEGIPTPDNPVEIKTQIIGKNLFEIKEKDKEIERLNNIIDKLENYIKQSNITDNDNYGYPTEFKIIYVDSLLEKLRELKEGK